MHLRRASIRRGRERTSGRRLRGHVQLVQQRGECLQIGQAEDGTSGRELTEGVRGSEGGPGSGKGADLSGKGIEEEDARFPPRPALCEEGELLIGEGVKGMRDGTVVFTIRAIGCS
jgi:hypothetical protein